MGATQIIVVLSIFIVVAPVLSKYLRIPVSVVEMFLGTIGGYFGVFSHSDYFIVMAKVGFLFLMFLAGLEVNLQEFIRVKSLLLKRSIAYFCLLYLFSLMSVLFFHLPYVFVVILPIFSLGMIMTLIKEYGKDRPWLSLALLIGILGELISIIALTILSGAVSLGFGIDFVKTMAKLVGIVVGAVFLFKVARAFFWWFPGAKSAIMPHVSSKEQDVRFSIALFFIMIAAMLYLKIDMVLGAFFAGIFIASFFAHKKDLHEKLSSFGFGFLVPIFFIYVGSTLKLAYITSSSILLYAALLSVLMISIRFIGSFIAFSGYLGVKNTVLFAFSDSMPLTFMVACATICLKAGAIDISTYSSIIVSSMLSAIVLMTGIKPLSRLFSRQEQSHAI